MCRLLLPLFLFTYISQARGNFCNTNLKNINPQLIHREQDFALKIVSDQKDEILWLTKHTGFLPKIVKRKKILEEGKIFISIPIQNKNEKFFVTLQYETILNVMDSSKVNKSAILNKVSAINLNGAKIKLDDKLVEEILNFATEAKPGELINFRISDEIQFQLIPKLSESSLQEYNKLMKAFLFLAERNTLPRPFSKLTEIQNYQQYTIFKKKMRIRNAIAFAKDRTKKQLVTLGLVSLGSYVTYKATGNQDFGIELHDLKKQKDLHFLIEESEGSIHFIPKNQKEYFETDKVKMQDLNKKYNYDFKVKKDSSGTIYLKLE